MALRRLGWVFLALFLVAALVWVWWLPAGREAPSDRVPEQDASVAVPRGEPRSLAATSARPDEGAAPSLPTLRLPPALLEQAPEAAAGALTGRVVSAATGLPVAGAEVTLSAPSGGATSQVTDSDGRFDFLPERPGTYQVASARADGFVPFGPEWGRSPIAVAVQPGVRVKDVVIALMPTRELVVTVRSEAGAPVPGASARVLYANAGEAALFPQKERFTSDGQGQFRVEASEGASVEAWHPKLGSGAAELDAEAIAAGEIEVRLSAAEAGARSKLSGRVELPDGSGAPGALVWVRSAVSAFPTTYGNPRGHRALTDQEGRFELPELEAGLYDVSAHLIGFGPARVSDLRVPSEVLKLKLEGGAVLRGVVRDEGGAPVPAFAVDLRWNKGPLVSSDYAEGTFVGPTGQYSLGGLREGRYTLNVFANGFVARQGAVEVPPGASEMRADFTLERGGTVTGTVRSEGSRAPVAGARVGLEGLFSSGALSTSYTAMTDPHGRFELEGVPSSGASLFVSAQGHNSRLVRATPGAIEILLSQSAPDAGPRVELVGVGAVLMPREDALVVGQVMPGGGAAEAGLAPGDELVTVDGKPVVEVGWPAVVEVIRGQAGTQVIFGVRKGGKPPLVQLAVTRRRLGT